VKTHSGSISIPRRTCQIPSETQLRKQMGAITISAAELAERAAIEWAHDHDTSVAHAPTEAELDAERKKRAGLCPRCGKLIGNVERCPICKSVLWKETREKVAAANRHRFSPGSS